MYLSDTRRTHSLEEINRIINNKRFDPNIKNDSGESVLYVLSWNKYRNKYFKDIVENILKRYPNVVVSSELISDLMGSNNTEMLQVYKKYKKIPKSLKGLV